MSFDKVRYNRLFYAVLHSSEILISNRNLDSVMNEVVSVLGEAAAVDRCYVFENVLENDIPVRMHYAYEWVKQGVNAHIDDPMLQDLVWEDYADLNSILSIGQSFYTNTKDIQDLAFKEALEVQKIKSILFTPIIFDNKFWGYLGFDDCTSEREWLDMEISTLVSITANIAAFLKRVELAKELEAQYVTMHKQKVFYESIFNNIPADIVALDRDHRYLFLNKNSVKDDAIREWLVGKDDFDYFELKNKDLAIAKVRRQNFLKMLEDKLPYSFEEKFDLGGGKYRKHLRVMQPVVDEKGEVSIAIGYGLDITRISEQEELILRQNEAISNSPDGIALLDKEGKYYYMNRAHEEIFGYGPEGLIGESWHILYEPEELKRINEDVFPILGAKGIWNGETVGLSKSGKYVYQDITLRLLDDGSLICITRDVSPLVQNMHLLEKANQKLELAINTSNLGMWEWNLVSDELESNDIFRDILGLDSEGKFTSVRHNWLSAIHPDDRQMVVDAMNSQIRVSGKEQPKYNIEYRILKNTGKYIWVLDFGKVVDYDDHGNPQNMVGFTLDITEKRTIEDQIRNSEKRYRDLVENLREVIFEMDEKGNFVFLNPAWSKMTGYSIEESIGKGFSNFIDMQSDGVVLENFKIFFFSNASDNMHFELPVVHKKGHLVWFDVEVNKIITDDNGLKGMVGSIEDITKRKVAEGELKAALEKEKQLGDLKSRFVSMASHEFRTPLAGIRSSAELLKMQTQRIEEFKVLAEKHQVGKKLDNIIFDVDRITSLMTDVLTMGSIESAKIPFNPVVEDIAAFTKNYLGNEAIRYLKGNLFLYDGLDEAIDIPFDPKLITHVFNNLVSNASKYSKPESAITIHMEKDERWVSISFEDQGIGIPKSELPFIMESFFRSSIVENIPGTGLGLSIAKYFIEMHRGRIQLESTVGVGTKVTIQLPFTL